VARAKSNHRSASRVSLKVPVVDEAHRLDRQTASLLPPS
jgi:hypothetical protein